MPFRLFMLWAVVTMVLMLMALSDCAFGESTLGQLARRCLLALVWPFAILSTSGRSFLINNARGL